MSFSTESLRERESTYFVQDRENKDELTRLEIQDKMLTSGMGGVLSEIADPTTLHRVIDVGCGTGGWLFETAKTYPTIETLIGADISVKLLSYVRGQEEAQKFSKRIEFRVMDALMLLEFRPAFFDLVNQRMGASWLRTWEWTKLLTEYQRVTRTGGIIRITEADIVESNSPALTKLCNIALETFYQSGRLFTKTNDGLTHRIPLLMTQHGIEDVQTKTHILIFKPGTNEHQSFYEDMGHFFRLLVPFFQKWTHVPNNYEEIYQQALKEMQEPEFVATWKLLTAWGLRHSSGKLFLMRGLK